MAVPDIDIPQAVQHPLASGLAGALVGLRWAPGDTWLQRITNVVAGSLLAGYCGPWVSDMLGQHTPSAQSAIGFGLGLFGLSLAGSIARACAEMDVADIVRSWLTRR